MMGWYSEKKNGYLFDAPKQLAILLRSVGMLSLIKKTV